MRSVSARAAFLMFIGTLHRLDSKMSYGALKNFRSTLYRLDKRLWPCKSIDQCARFCMMWSIVDEKV